MKNRWLRDVADQLEGSQSGVLAFEDLDLDNDMVELRRVTGTDLLGELSRAILRGAPLPERGTACLAPELEGEAAATFLRLVGLNLAFRLRTDDALEALLEFTARASSPALDPTVAGALLARARSERAARALVEASPLEGGPLEAALEAVRPPELNLRGARLHLLADHEAVEKALVRALKPLAPLPWTQAPTRELARRFLALRRRGGWTTVLEEGDQPPAALAPDLARAAGVTRVVWASFGDGPPALALHEGSRAVLDTAALTERIGSVPTEEDVAGELRALGILDLDPQHPRGLKPLTFASAIETRKRGVLSLAFSPCV